MAEKGFSHPKYEVIETKILKKFWNPDIASSNRLIAKSSSGGKIGGYKLILLGIEHSAANAFRANIPTMIPRKGYGSTPTTLNQPIATQASFAGKLGGLIGGLQFVENGQASSRLINAGAGAVVAAGFGVAANKIGSSLLKLYDARQTRKFNQYVSEVNFGSEEKLTRHFSKHGVMEFKETYANSLEYLEGARDVMKHGYKVQYNYPSTGGTTNEIRTGYVKFMGNSKTRNVEEIVKGITKLGKHREGTMKFEFVGTNNDGYLTTYHVKNSKELFKLLNGNKLYEIN